jgi:hypothetical protein
MDITELSRQKSGNRHPWELTRYTIIKHFIRKYHPNCYHILDIGSGDAFVIKSLYQQGIGKEFTAIDTAYTPEIIHQLKHSDLSGIQFSDHLPASGYQKADCLLILDVLEHCEDDAAVVQQIRNYTTAESTLIITVPAFQSIFSSHDRQLGHYRRYTITQLKSLCTENGFTPVHSGYFFFSLLIVRIITRMFEAKKKLQTKKTIDNWNNGPILTRAICLFLWVDFLLGRLLNKLSIKLPGLSAYCICQPLPS